MVLQLSMLLFISMLIVAEAVFEAISADDYDSLIKQLNVYQPNLQNLQDPNSRLLNRRGPGKQTPLMFAVLSGKERAVQILLEHGARVDIGEENGYTPMHGAGFQGRSTIVKMLVEHGVNPSDMHSDGHTPYHRACWGKEQRHTDTVRAFLEVGVPIDELSREGKSCMDMTTNPDTVALLKKWNKVNLSEL